MVLKYPSPNPIFLIGTSGKGLEHLFNLAGSLPKGFPAPFVFLLHRIKKANKNQQSIYELMKKKSQLDVHIAHDGMEFEPGNIYLPELGKHLLIKDGKAVLSTEPDDSFWMPSIDKLFISAAQDYKSSTVSVLLSGGMEDGIDGLIETTHQGGVTIAQSPEDAYNPILPLNALIKDHPSYVLPLRDMPPLFCELIGMGCYPDQTDILHRAAEAAARRRKNPAAK